MERTTTTQQSTLPATEVRPGRNAIERIKDDVGGNGLLILESVPDLIRRGSGSLTPAEKELLKWVGVFARKPTPGKFMMRIRMPNGFASSAQLRAIAELSRKLGNSVMDITTRQQIELRGFTLDSVPEIWEKLRGVDLHSLQTGMDNVRNINGCPLAGLSPHELLDASAIVRELDRLLVGVEGNPEFANLPRKFNITVTGCRENCTHCEAQDIALIPARQDDRIGLNVLVGGKMGSGGFTIAAPLDVFVQELDAARTVIEIVRIFRDHGPREARSKARLAFLIQEWGIPRLRRELAARLGRDMDPAGEDVRLTCHADHLGIEAQKQPGLHSVGLCVRTGRVQPEQLEDLARLAEEYGDGQVRFTTGQNVILPNVPRERLRGLGAEPLLEQFSPNASPFVRGLVACVGTDFCNLALIETKARALRLSEALEKTAGQSGNPLTIHWSGCPAGCGNHQAADIGMRGFRAKLGDEVVDAVAIYTGGRTGPHAVAGEEILAMVPCDDKLPEVVAGVIEKLEVARQAERLVPQDVSLPVPMWMTEIRISPAERIADDQRFPAYSPMREIIAVIRAEKWNQTARALESAGIHHVAQQRVLGRGRQRGLRYFSHAKGPSEIRYLPKRMLHIYVHDSQVDVAIQVILTVNSTNSMGDGKIFLIACEEAKSQTMAQDTSQLAASRGKVA